MEPLKKINGIAAVLNRTNVDTDQIIPKQFLKHIGRTGFGQNLFFDWRYLENGSENPKFELNRPELKGANILIAGDNFGCGSSREHAPWALNEYGFRVIVSTSFADIFFNNCYKNSMLPIIVSPQQLEQLMLEASQNLGVKFDVDVALQSLITPSGLHINFEINSFRKEFLLKGLDDIDWTMKLESKISTFEHSQKQSMPWLWS